MVVDAGWMEMEMEMEMERLYVCLQYVLQCIIFTTAFQCLNLGPKFGISVTIIGIFTLLFAEALYRLSASSNTCVCYR